MPGALRGQSAASRCAFVLVHFGNRPDFFEATLFFIRNLAQHTLHNIIWMYSVLDTPLAFVSAMSALVFSVAGYDESGFTAAGADGGEALPLYPPSARHSLGTVRTCNFAFAHLLVDYDVVCIIENDMVVVADLDDVFGLPLPAMRSLYYGDPVGFAATYDDAANIAEPLANTPFMYDNTEREVLAYCSGSWRSNGGMMLFAPRGAAGLAACRAALAAAMAADCKYPNETVFELTNLRYHNIPCVFHTSHYQCRRVLELYRVRANYIRLFHYNETRDKPLVAVRDSLAARSGDWTIEGALARERGRRVATGPFKGDWHNCAILGYAWFKDKVFYAYAAEVAEEMAAVAAAMPRGLVLSAPLSNSVIPVKKPKRKTAKQGAPTKFSRKQKRMLKP